MNKHDQIRTIANLCDMLLPNLLSEVLSVAKLESRQAVDP